MDGSFHYFESKDKLKRLLSRNLTNINNYIDLFNKINSISRDDIVKPDMNISLKYSLSEFQKDFFLKYFKF